MQQYECPWQAPQRFGRMMAQKDDLLMTQTQAQQRTTEAAAPDWQNLATKADLAELRSRMAFMATKEDLVELRTRLEFMATKEDLAELRGEFASLRGSLKTAVWFAGLVIGLVQIGLFFLQRSLG